MITKAPEGKEDLLQVSNAHGLGCGLPPVIDARDKYVSYFENVTGEQWLAVGDRDSKTMELYSGDLGWNRVQILTPEHPRPDAYMSEEESYWLAACIAAAFKMPIAKLGKKFRQSPSAS